MPKLSKTIYFAGIIVISVMISGCNQAPGDNAQPGAAFPRLEPDYSGLTIPTNIAPMNFLVKEDASHYFVRIHAGGNGTIDISSQTPLIDIPKRKWERLLSGNAGKELIIEISARDESGIWKKFKPVTNHIASEAIDPYIYYRLLYPGYESWSDLSINYRNLQNFTSRVLIENRAAGENCINCHSFNNGKTDNFMFHMRGSMGGTYIWSGGRISKHNLKTDEMKNGAVYPRWHPSGRFIAFSSNRIIQRFHASDNKKVEVSDLESSLVLYDAGSNKITGIPLAGREVSMDTYPEWSPDGKTLYFCRAPQIGEEYDYREIRYSLWKASFNMETLQFGEPELLFDADSLGKSIAFPRVSPDGRFIAVTLFDYGCFPIWHKEADIVLVDTANGEVSSPELNSEFADSYHSWSSNGRWIIFSSKRDDGLTARPYIAYVDSTGKSSKPFILPQKDPSFYGRFLKSFNIPEFSTERIKLTPGELRRLVRQEPIQAEWGQ